jgi:multidrug resistance protein MdtO
LGTFLPSLSQWYKWVLEDLQPTPGRLGSSLRVVLSVVLALILLLVLQVPFVSLVLYIIFVVGRESPAVSLRSALLSLVTGCVAVFVSLGVVIATDNDPMTRLLSVAAMSFVAGVLTQASSFAPLAPTFGLLYCTVIALWENQIPADMIVKTSLFLIAAESVALGSTVFVEYLFATRSAVERLLEERRIRYRALEAMFRAYARGASPDELFAAHLPVARLALAGQRDMQDLYQVIVERNLDPKGLPPGMRVRIAQLAEFVDVSAAFGAAQVSDDGPWMRERCAWIADRCRELGETLGPQENFPRMAKSGIAALRPVEETLGVILAMPPSVDPGDGRPIVLPTNKIPFFVPGALKAKGTFTFGLKISLCATLCYILYHALDYPGISTAVTTVLVSGLTTTGAMKQKLAHRLAGAIVGGLLLGLGSIVFLFPLMDSITALSGLVGAVAFIAAWTAAGRRFSYIGLQIAFSFFAVTLATSSAPTELAPARDRLVGIGLALVIMWFVFDQVWPVRTITMMRQALASVLRGVAQLLSVASMGMQPSELRYRIDGLRHQVSARIGEIRNLHEAVLYEFGVDHEAHKAAGEIVLRAALSSGSLFWNELAVLERRQDRDVLTAEGLLRIRSVLANRLETLADAVLEHKPISAFRETELELEHFPRGSREAEYAKSMVSRYKEFESILLDLPGVSFKHEMGQASRQ